MKYPNTSLRTVNFDFTLVRIYFFVEVGKMTHKIKFAKLKVELKGGSQSFKNDIGASAFPNSFYN